MDIPQFTFAKTVKTASVQGNLWSIQAANSNRCEHILQFPPSFMTYKTDSCKKIAGKFELSVAALFMDPNHFTAPSNNCGCPM